jgi:hypothetical protein
MHQEHKQTTPLSEETEVITIDILYEHLFPGSSFADLPRSNILSSFKMLDIVIDPELMPSIAFFNLMQKSDYIKRKDLPQMLTKLGQTEFKTLLHSYTALDQSTQEKLLERPDFTQILKEHEQFGGIVSTSTVIKADLATHAVTLDIFLIGIQNEENKPTAVVYYTPFPRTQNQ